LVEKREVRDRGHAKICLGELPEAGNCEMVIGLDGSRARSGVGKVLDNDAIVAGMQSSLTRQSR
jgi:hypothetical protein